MTRTFSDFPIGLQLWSKTRRQLQALHEGYTFSLLDHSSDTYHFAILTGMAKVRSMFEEFARTMPEEAFFILEFYTAEPTGNNEDPPPPTVHYSPYMPIREILETLEPYWDRLMNDGFVGFGLANNRASLELFYSEEKVLTCFTDNHIRLMDKLARTGIPHQAELPLHTEIGHDHLSLLCLERRDLPPSLQGFGDRELDYAIFCRELVETFGMYPVEESLSFFFSKREQQFIENLLQQLPGCEDFVDEDFGCLLLDWNDFVNECIANFEGDLWEYRQGLKLRDLIQHIIDASSEDLGRRICEAIEEADERFRKNLIGHRKRLDAPGEEQRSDDHFWYNGVIRNAGVDLRRDLIRHGWYKP